MDAITPRIPARLLVNSFYISDPTGSTSNRKPMTTESIETVESNEGETVPAESSLPEIGFDEDAARAWLEYFLQVLGTDVSRWSDRMEELLAIEGKVADFRERAGAFGVRWEEAMEEYLESKSQGVPLKHMRTAYEKTLIVQRSHTALLRQFDAHLASTSFDAETRKMALRNLGRMMSAHGASLHLLTMSDVKQWLDGQELTGPTREKLETVFEGFLEFIKKSTLSGVQIS